MITAAFASPPMKIPTRRAFYSLPLALAFSAGAFAGPLSVTNEFVADTPAIAADVNQNFSDVEAAVNDNDARITGNTLQIQINRADLDAILAPRIITAFIPNLGVLREPDSKDFVFGLPSEYLPNTGANDIVIWPLIAGCPGQSITIATRSWSFNVGGGNDPNLPPASAETIDMPDPGGGAFEIVRAMPIRQTGLGDLNYIRITAVTTCGAGIDLRGFQIQFPAQLR